MQVLVLLADAAVLLELADDAIQPRWVDVQLTAELRHGDPGPLEDERQDLIAPFAASPARGRPRPVRPGRRAVRATVEVHPEAVGGTAQFFHLLERRTQLLI